MLFSSTRNDGISWEGEIWVKTTPNWIDNDACSEDERKQHIYSLLTDGKKLYTSKRWLPGVFVLRFESSDLTFFFSEERTFKGLRGISMKNIDQK